MPSQNPIKREKKKSEAQWASDERQEYRLVFVFYLIAVSVFITTIPCIVFKGIVESQRTSPIK